jgi:putative endonuclease
MAQAPADMTGRAPHLVRGTRAEDVAAAYLERAGYEILGRNVRVGRAEIDLLVREGVVIVIVEVRTRGLRSYQRALDSIDTKKRARLRAAGERLWRARYARDTLVERMRFDAIAVDLDRDGAPSVEHIRAAF